jgi:hypothetical protein
MDKGRDVEKSVLKSEGLVKNTKKIEAIDPKTGKLGKTKPDAIAPDGTTIEVKDRQYLTDSEQLRRQSQISAKAVKGGKATVIQAREGGRVSETVLKRMNVRPPQP